jgi:hypothetical protein
VKKILSILLLMVYTAASSGTVISAHYCMGDLAAVSFGERDSHGCEFCGMEDEGCCHDLPQVIKIDNSVLESQVIAGFDFSPAFSSVLFFDHYNISFTCKTPNTKSFFHRQFIKPPPYLLNCNFRI